MRRSGAAGQRGSGAAKRAAWLALLLAAPLPRCPGLQAQEAAPRSVDARPWFASVSHYGKWLALAGAASLTAVAIARNEDADRVYDGLNALCRAGGQTCVLNAQGTYINPEAEALYQETLRLDSQARKWMIGGEAALVVAGTMFVIDLVAGTRRPKNIPFSPYTAGRNVGVSVRF